MSHLPNRSIEQACIAVLAMLGALAGPAHSLDFIWLGGTANWSPAGNLSQAGLPGGGENVLIDGGNLAKSVTVE